MNWANSGTARAPEPEHLEHGHVQGELSVAEEVILFVQENWPHMSAEFFMTVGIRCDKELRDTVELADSIRAYYNMPAWRQP